MEPDDVLTLRYRDPLQWDRESEVKKRLYAFVFVAALGVIAGCGGSGGDAAAPVMPQVVGKRLDVAKSDIKRAGIDDEVEVLGGGTFGVVKESNWTVCEQLPAAGKAAKDAPRLTVERSCEDDAPNAADDASTTTPPTTATAPAATQPVPAENLTATNSPDLAAFLSGPDCDDTLTAFAEKYRGRNIEFDGNIAYMSPHENYQTRYDMLVYTGDFNPDSARGPSFKFQDVNMPDLHLTGPNIPDSISQGTNLHIVAEVVEFKKVSCLFFLKPVSTQVR